MTTDADPTGWSHRQGQTQQPIDSIKRLFGATLSTSCLSRQFNVNMAHRAKKTKCGPGRVELLVDIVQRKPALIKHISCLDLESSLLISSYKVL